MKPANEAATKASSTTGQRRLGGWRAPTSASARSAASAPIASASSSPGSRPSPMPEPGHQVVALAGERRGVGPGLGGARRRPRSRASWRSPRRPRSPSTPRSPPARRPRGCVRRARPRARGRPCARSTTPPSRATRARPRRPCPVSSGSPAYSSGIGHAGGRVGRRRERAQPLRGEVGAVGVARPAVEEGPDADPAAARVAEALDGAVVDADLAARGLLAPRLGLARAGRQRRVDARAGERLEVGSAHAAVPPTVSSRMRTWGWPTPASTRWPALPQ